MAEQNQDVVIARSNSGDIGRTNITPDSIAEVRLQVPCYKDYLLQEKDSDKQKTWGASTQTEAGTWVKDLQEDLISFGIEKYGLVVEHAQPRPPKIIKTTTHEPLMRHGEAVMKHGHPVMKAVVHKTIEPQPDKVLYWEKVTLKPSGVFDKATTAALKLFQWHGLKVGKRIKDGGNVTAPITFTSLVTGKMDAPTCLEIKEWRAKGYKIIGPDIGASITVNMDKFIELYNSAPNSRQSIPEPYFKKLIPEYENNLKEFLGYMAADTAITDIRWGAYMLGTAMLEGRCLADDWAMTWAPVKETPVHGLYNKGAYGNPESVKDRAGHLLDANGQRLSPNGTPIMAQYFGRGYVQLTHQDNYRNLDQVLGLNGKIHITPDEVLTIKISYDIASLGMREGLFMRPHKFADYFTATATNYTAARAIINGRDRASVVAHFAEVFEWIIYNSLEITA